MLEESKNIYKKRINQFDYERIIRIADNAERMQSQKQKWVEDYEGGRKILLILQFSSSFLFNSKKGKKTAASRGLTCYSL